ncbi:uridine phosphorylase 1-like isoform X2 [Aricia agestis]|nr:uridine phosphorylase 1-like isoform X2 [Aricia agestis]
MTCNCDYILPTAAGWQSHYDNCRPHWEMTNGKPCPKNEDRTIRLQNPHLAALECDVLYHLGLDTKNYDLPAMFGDVKFVCMGGTKLRMRELARYLGEVLQTPTDLVNITKHSHRYAMYKVGPVLCVNHGIGIPSLTIVLEEVIKLLHYARARDPVIIRVGTSGGLGIPAGSVVISAGAFNGTLEQVYDIPVMGKVRKLPAVFDRRLNQELQSLVPDDAEYRTFCGITMAANEFYRGQARLDGPFCDYTAADKMAFLSRLVSLGVRNIEMEATAFAAITHEAGMRATDVCVTYLDRLKGDQVTPSAETLASWQKRPMEVIGKYIKKYCELKLKK